MSNLGLDHRYSRRVAKSGGGLDLGNPGRAGLAQKMIKAQISNVKKKQDKKDLCSGK